MTHTGYLVIADISGYTAFLSRSELEHARDSLNSLLGLLVEQTRQPLLISRLQGDAVFSYAFDEQVAQSQTLVDMIEQTYLAFRRARELMVLNTTCDCQACRNIPHLDLKFFVHHGRYAFQDVGEYKELVGTDVNTVHRLTKNSIVRDTGIQAYAAYTQAAIDALGMAGYASGFARHREQYEHIGEVAILVQDLNEVWQRERDSLRFEVRPEDALVWVEGYFPLPPALLWQYLTDPKHRAVVHGSDWQKLVEQPGDRIGPGAVYECAHGNWISRNAIVDWHPFEQYTTFESTPIPKTHTHVSYLLAPDGEGTRLTYVCSRSQGPFPLRLISDLGGRRVLAQRINASFTAFRSYIEAEIAAGRAPVAAAPQPAPGAIEQAVTESLSKEEPDG